MEELDFFEIDQIAENDQYLTFILSEDEFAVPITQIKEIIKFRELAYVPMMPDFIRGALNLRGSVVPVVDLAERFGLPLSDLSKRTCIVIMELEREDDRLTIGFVVDKVLQVMDLNEKDVEEAPTFGSKIRTDFIAGMGAINDSFIVILNIENVLSLDEISLVSKLQKESEEEEVTSDSTEEHVNG